MNSRLGSIRTTSMFGSREAHVLGRGGPAPAAADDHDPRARLGREVALHAASRTAQPGEAAAGQHAQAESRRPQELPARDRLISMPLRPSLQFSDSRPGVSRIYESARRRVKENYARIACLTRARICAACPSRCDRRGQRGRRVLDPAAGEHHDRRGCPRRPRPRPSSGGARRRRRRASGAVQMPSTRARSRWASTISRSLTAAAVAAGLAEDPEHLPAREGPGHAQARRVGDRVLPQSSSSRPSRPRP